MQTRNISSSNDQISHENYHHKEEIFNISYALFVCFTISYAGGSSI